MPSRAEIYRAKAEMCEHLANAAGDDSDTKQRALKLAQQWRDMARETEEAEERDAQLNRWLWFAEFLKKK